MLAYFQILKAETVSLTSESVKGLSLALQGIDNIHSSDSLTAGMLSVGHTVTDHIFQKDLENTTGLLCYVQITMLEGKIDNQWKLSC